MAFHTGSCFHGNLDSFRFQPGKYLLQKTIQFIWNGQETGPLIFCGHSGGGTAQIQVNFPVAIAAEFLGRPDKILRFICQDLWNQGYPGIMSGKDIIFLPGTQLMILGRREKGRKVLICAQKKSVMRIPLDISGYPLHRCKIVFHIVSFLHNLHCSSHHSVKDGADR